MVSTRSTSAALAFACAASATSPVVPVMSCNFPVDPAQRRPGSLRPSNAAGGGPDAHANPRGVALAQDVSRHHLASDEDVRARAPLEPGGKGVVHGQRE